ncbi:MAG: 30S ribosomal protein S20 [candidate division NC10 bacterium]|nr:30S ribosomal protein S20 [candidate division NC10 bacterium]
MPRTQSAIKQMRVNNRRRIRNRSARTALRTTIKKVRAAIAARDLGKAQEALAHAIPVIDKAVAKGITHKNSAARYKSRLARQVNALQASIAS